ncbi:hypothetical protein BVRB_9g211250 [Beta vulgaris subsp. vulgaris]|uniref:uncharacterized protein LOC104903661 n=1 Tax=Beta vulgaris subsp. vulgaris TaxID=3555 RepID=UPI000540352C|nr:uncharacterized protein LOC104903661 [Beta vulgaris subsp. vulgaris]KMT01664.1 hypothetical protein BVRB_9g211250 [Beta vulgaris subsp. vulgaris]
MAASIGGRSTLLLRNLCNKTTSLRFSISPPSTSSPFFLRRTPISPSSSSSSFRLPRELCSLLPAHSAIASACLVSRLPDGLNSSAECRFANYISPI